MRTDIHLYFKNPLYYAKKLENFADMSQRFNVKRFGTTVSLCFFSTFLIFGDELVLQKKGDDIEVRKQPAVSKSARTTEFDDIDIEVVPVDQSRGGGTPPKAVKLVDQKSTQQVENKKDDSAIPSKDQLTSAERRELEGWRKLGSQPILIRIKEETLTLDWAGASQTKQIGTNAVLRINLKPRI